jgi:hypothetical protein
MPASVDPSLRIDPDESRPAQRGAGAGARAMAFVLLAAAAAGGVYWWYLDAQPTDPAPSTRAAPAAPTQPPAPAPQVLAAPPVPQPAHPIAAQDIGSALAELLGSRTVQALVQLGDFPRRVVATVDNLGRESAPSSLWPVVASPGRFEVDEAGEGAVPSAGNAARYATLVQAAEAMDAARAVDVYRRMYPLLQQAYRQLGLGDRSFNDRLLQVIDLLLATPEPAQPPRVHLLEVKGPVPSTRPWVRYQYVDPALEKLAAGQKILLRVGLDNERRLKNKLRELRRELLAPARPAS